MSNRLKHEILSGPDGEVLKISWMPDKRVRLDFIKCNCAVTKVFPNPKGDTHVELKYGMD
jgi:hypothetical protein